MGKLKNIGIFAVLIGFGYKLAPLFFKLGKVLLKLAKPLLGFKTIGAGASLGLYSLIFSWQMGVSLVVFILIHEYGHLLAMKRCGIKTKGIYLIPGLGGAAVAAEKFHSARNEAYIAIMGPLFSLIFIFPMILLYFYTFNPMFAAIASTMSLINLFNLFPINPLDGGRITKSLLYSIGKPIGFFFTIFCFVIALVASFLTGFFLLAIIAIIGFGEITEDYALKNVLKNLFRTFWRGVGFFVIFRALIILLFAGISFQGFLCLLLSVLIIIFFIIDALGSPLRDISYSYPELILKEARRGLRELFSIKTSDLKRIDNYRRMGRRNTARYSFVYLLTIALMLILIFYTGKIPGCQHAKELLM